MFLERFIDIFTVRNAVIKETIDTVELNTVEDVSLPDIDSFSKTLSLLNNRDKLFVSFQIGENDAITFTNDVTAFLKECTTALSIRDDEYISFSIRIEKKKNDNKISIYSLDSFIDYLNSLRVLDMFNIFKNICNTQQGFVFFELQSQELNFFTRTIQFAPIGESIRAVDISEIRDTRSDGIKNICHTNLLNAYKFLPEDFHEISNVNHENISSIFKRLSLLSSISYLFDIVQIDNKNINYRLNGYKTINGLITFDDINITCETEYYKIYEWCYCDGNTTDKVGLARNIISLHLSQIDDIVLCGNPFYSILSSFKIYRKQNIKQYIEIRNKISDNLLDFKNKADNIVESFASDFKKSLFAFISFFASVVIIQVLRNGNFIGVFTVDATILSFAFLVVMLLFFFASRWEIKAQKKRYGQTYQNMKDRYKDLLNEDDIKRILNNDNDYNANIKFINSKSKAFSWLWIGTVMIFFITILILFFINNINLQKVLETLKKVTNMFVILLLFRLL